MCATLGVVNPVGRAYPLGSAISAWHRTICPTAPSSRRPRWRKPPPRCSRSPRPSARPPTVRRVPTASSGGPNRSRGIGPDRPVARSRQWRHRTLLVRNQRDHHGHRRHLVSDQPARAQRGRRGWRRAGEAGKGFAVVASEVRALAQRSAEAAKDVKTRIHASSDQVGVGSSWSTRRGEALQRIIGRIGEISDLVSQIAAFRHSTVDRPATGQHRGRRDGRRDPAQRGDGRTGHRRRPQPWRKSRDAAREVARFRLADMTGDPRNPVHQMQRRLAAG